jgi:hypothetical protein
MSRARNLRRKIGLRDRAFHVACRSVISLFIAACASAPPCACAQSGEDVPTIRVETDEVLIPTRVAAWVPPRGYGALRTFGYFSVPHLGASDFHLFEDGKEQAIVSAALARPYFTPVQRDNLGYQLGTAATPRGEWKDLHSLPIEVGGALSEPLYAIAYKPPSLRMEAATTSELRWTPRMRPDIS